MSTISSSASVNSLVNPSAPLTISGLATGLDTDKIIQGLLAIHQKTIDNIQAKENKVLQQQQAFKGIEARLLSLQGKISQLARPQNSVFDGRSATSSNKDLLTAAAGPSAVPGNYSLQVNSLAKVNQVASQGFDSANSLITQGTLQLQAGGATVTVTIDDSNNTLTGLANAINNSGADVVASVINDGWSSAAQPYRLLLTAKKTGTANAIRLTNGLAADGGAAFKPIFDSNSIGSVALGAGFSGTSTPTSNRGAGAYTGTTNNAYTFTVLAGGTVGTDNNLQISYTDSTGANQGTLTLNAGDVGNLKSVAQGLEVQFSAGTLIAGQTFTIRAFVPQVQQATDASVTIGSGSGALTVTNATNQIDGLFSGISLNLVGADSAKTVTLSVTNDTEKAKQAIQDFVAGYNDFLAFTDDQVKYDSASGQGGILLGNRQVLSIQDQVRAAVTDPIPGLNPRLNYLGALGITTNDQGHLTINSSKLDDVLASRLAGVDLNDVRKLFVLAGASSNPGIQFITAGGKTKVSTTPYQVNVSQAATQANILASSALATTTVLSAANNTLILSLDGGLPTTITLNAGSYTQQALAQEIQTQINGNANLTGKQVAVGLVDGKLSITSKVYGSASTVAISGGTGLDTLGFLGSETSKGLDVAGSYLAGGVAEAALGNGQFLVGNADNANTANLQVRVTLSTAQVGNGLSADLNVTRGVASKLDLALNSLLDSTTGRLNTIDQGFQTTIDDFKKEIDRQNEIMTARRNSLLKQFAALEDTVSQLQNLGNYLTAQFNSITGTSSTKK